jgi:small subunit ribosomal protein S6
MAERQACSTRPRRAFEPAAAILGAGMADAPILYDLVLLLSNDAPEEQRERILSSVETTITGAGGSIERNDDWGKRPMAYEIRHVAEADYHLLQFHAPPSLIEELTHTLHITDGVLRVRIIKVRPGTPPVKPGAPPVVSAVSSGGFSPEGSRGSGRASTQTLDEDEGAPGAGTADEPSEAVAGVGSPGEAGDYSAPE